MYLLTLVIFLQVFLAHTIANVNASKNPASNVLALRLHRVVRRAFAPEVILGDWVDVYRISPVYSVTFFLSSKDFAVSKTVRAALHDV